jgi:hypothetical protein
VKAQSWRPREGRVAWPERRMRERMRGEQSGVRMEERRKGREQRGEEQWWRQEEEQQEQQEEKHEKQEHRWQRQRQQLGHPLLRRCTNAVRCNSQKKKKDWLVFCLVGCAQHKSNVQSNAWQMYRCSDIDVVQSSQGRQVVT